MKTGKPPRCSQAKGCVTVVIDEQELQRNTVTVNIMETLVQVSVWGAVLMARRASEHRIFTDDPPHPPLEPHNAHSQINSHSANPGNLLLGRKPLWGVCLRPAGVGR